MNHGALPPRSAREWRASKYTINAAVRHRQIILDSTSLISTDQFQPSAKHTNIKRTTVS